MHFHALLTSPLFSITLCIAAYCLGKFLFDKTKFVLCNPLLLAIVITGGTLLLLKIDYADFAKGGDMISLFLSPAVVVLALPIARNLPLLRRHFIPVLTGALVGSAVSMFSVWGMTKLCGIDGEVLMSMIPKSITTPIAMEVSAMIGGIPPLTVACVVLTGIMGSMLAPLLIRAVGKEDELSCGVAMGTCAHAIGTAKALEYGETMGALAGVSISLAGIFTVIFCTILFAI